MDIKKINELMAESRWKAMLNELPVGKHTLQFPDVKSINSCKAIAYDINSNKEGRRYTFNVCKDNKTANISVEEIYG